MSPPSPSAEPAGITVITSVRDGMPYLPAALESVRTQGVACDHVVIDAGSRDGSAEFLRQRDDIRLIERPGLPLYDAWTLGLRAAHHPFVAFVNADDILAPGALLHALAEVSADPATEILCGTAEAFLQDGAILRRYRTTMDLDHLAFEPPAINAMIFRGSVLAEGFETRWRMAGDRATLVRLAVSERPLRVRHSDRLLYRYRVHPGSQTLWRDSHRREAIAREHIDLVDTFSAQFVLGAPQRRVLERWRSRERAALALALARQGRWAAAAGQVGEIVARPRLIGDTVGLVWWRGR